MTAFIYYGCAVCSHLVIAELAIQQARLMAGSKVYRMLGVGIYAELQKYNSYLTDLILTVNITRECWFKRYIIWLKF